MRDMINTGIVVSSKVLQNTTALRIVGENKGQRGENAHESLLLFLIPLACYSFIHLKGTKLNSNNDYTLYFPPFPEPLNII